MTIYGLSNFPLLYIGTDVTIILSMEINACLMPTLIIMLLLMILNRSTKFLIFTANAVTKLLLLPLLFPLISDVSMTKWEGSIHAMGGCCSGGIAGSGVVRGSLVQIPARQSL